MSMKAQGDQGEDFVVVAFEVRRLDLLAEIPVGFPVAETQPDAAFATDGARMLVEGGEIERLLSAETVTDHADTLGIDLGALSR